MTRRALITGISGQDGGYLSSLLLEKGYEVHGIIRPEALASEFNAVHGTPPLQKGVIVHIGSLESPISLSRAVQTIRPDECYHLAGPSFVNASFEEEPSILSAIVGGTHSLLAAIKEMAPECRFFLAGTSEMFGAPEAAPQDETTPFNPRSIYGLAKLSAHHTIRYYRDHYDIFGCTGLLYNHESPRRSPRFVTRKVTMGAAAIKLGLQQEIHLGDLEAVRDWGYAPEYVDAMWRMLQNDTAEDFVIATGQTRSVRDLVDVAFTHLGLEWQQHVVQDPTFMRAPEAVPLRGDASSIGTRLGWQASKSFDDIIREMVDHDVALLRNRRDLPLTGANGGTTRPDRENT